VNGLLTDLYELTMSAGYFAAGKWDEQATFELFIRRLPRHRNYVVAAGLAQAVESLLTLDFDTPSIDYLRKLPQFQSSAPKFFESLRCLRFAGDVDAVPEGTVLFAGEPMLRVRAALPQGQIPETALLATLTFQSLIATKAARVVRAAQGRAVVEFGTRRAHTADAGLLGARAAYIGGCIGTSNTLAGYRFGIPVMGTAAHSWILSFDSEREAFSRLQELLGPSTIQLLDTYDSVEGARIAASLGEPLWGVRLDSGDFALLSRQVRRILDEAGLADAKIMASGDLDEYKIAALVETGAPIDAFGVGTELATSADAPAMGAVYKLVEVGGRAVAKRSAEKSTLPGAKQIFRFPDHDVVGLETESCPAGAEPLLQPLVRNGKLLASLPDLQQSRQRAAESIAKLDARYHALEQIEHYPVNLSEELERLRTQLEFPTDEA
jgi:nicotinate phosphoribosyltransferase